MQLKEAKAILLKTKKDSEDTIAKCKTDTEKAKAKSLKHMEAAKKTKKDTELAIINFNKPINPISNPENTEDEFECNYRPEEFTKYIFYEEHLDLKTLTQLRKHSRKLVPIQEESTEESES